MIEGRLNIPVLPPKCEVTGELFFDDSTGKRRIIAQLPLTYSCLLCKHTTHDADTATRHYHDAHERKRKNIISRLTEVWRERL